MVGRRKPARASNSQRDTTQSRAVAYQSSPLFPLRRVAGDKVTASSKGDLIHRSSRAACSTRLASKRGATAPRNHDW
eukprot:4087896-Alexandrium_andersonii.AAC.1